MFTVGVKNADGLYGGDDIKLGNAYVKKMSDYEYKSLVHGSPRKYYRRFIRSSILASCLWPFFVGFSLFMPVLLASNDTSFDPKVASCCFGIAVSLLILAGVFIARKLAERKPMGGWAESDSKALRYVDFGQSEYVEADEKKARRRILFVGLTILAVLFFCFLVVDLCINRAFAEYRYIIDFYKVLDESIQVDGFPFSGVREIVGIVFWTISFFYLMGTFSGIAILVGTTFVPSEIPVYTCPVCKYFLTYICVERKELFAGKYEMKVGTTGGHEYQTGTVYDSSGNKVGYTTAWVAGNDIYEYGSKYTIWYKSICAKCGNVKIGEVECMRPDGRRVE